MKALYLNVKECKPLEMIEFDGEFDTCRRLIDCDCIDVVQRVICGVSVTIVCDDNGALESDRRLALRVDGFGDIYGNLIITGLPGSDGELTDVTWRMYFHLLINALFLDYRGHFFLDALWLGGVK